MELVDPGSVEKQSYHKGQLQETEHNHYIVCCACLVCNVTKDELRREVNPSADSASICLLSVQADLVPKSDTS